MGAWPWASLLVPRFMQVSTHGESMDVGDECQFSKKEKEGKGEGEGPIAPLNL